MSDTGGVDMRFVVEVMVNLMQSVHLTTIALAMHMIRFVVAMMVLPVTGEQIVNGMSRAGIALMLAAFVALGRPVDELENLGSGVLGLIAVKEIGLGVALGFVMSTAFWVVEYVGALVDTAAGFNSVQLQNPMSGEQSTPVSNLLSKLAGAVFFSIGGAVFFAQAMFDSFAVWPVIDLHPSAQAAYAVFIERQVGSMFANVLKLVAPVLIIVMLIDVGVGLLGRSAEKLEPASLAQPIKGVVSVLLLVLMIGSMFEPLRQYLVPRHVAQQLVPVQSAPAK